jgi:hypothetical protein
MEDGGGVCEGARLPPRVVVGEGDQIGVGRSDTDGSSSRAAVAIQPDQADAVAEPAAESLGRVVVRGVVDDDHRPSVGQLDQTLDRVGDACGPVPRRDDDRADRRPSPER